MIQVTYYNCTCLADEVRFLQNNGVTVIISRCYRNCASPWISVDIHTAHLMVELGYESVTEHPDIFWARSIHK